MFRQDFKKVAPKQDETFRKWDILNASPLSISTAGFYDPIFSNCHDLLAIKYPEEYQPSAPAKDPILRTFLERLWDDISLVDEKTAFVNMAPLNAMLSARKPYVPKLLHNTNFTEDKLLTPYQIHAVKLLMKTAPIVFTVGINPVLKMLIEWEHPYAFLKYASSGSNGNGANGSGANVSGANGSGPENTGTK